MSALTHFKNGIRCQHHNHGATCAIDVLIEIYFYCIYNKNYTFMDTSSTMVQMLQKLCHLRGTNRDAKCEYREEIWNWLLNEYPQAYGPKGTLSAETRVGLFS